MKILRCAVLLVLTGCANFDTHQYDERIKETFNPVTGKIIERERTRISTQAGSRTFFDSDSQLANWEAKQTEATQGAKVGSLSQASSGTNAVDLLKELNKLMAK